MEFELTEKELSYIIKKFSYKKLVGFSRKLFIKNHVEDSLLSKGYLVLQNNDFVLSNSLRILLSCWQKCRYTMSRPELVSQKNYQCILSNSESIICIDNRDSKLKINLFDFNIERMDRLVLQMAELPDLSVSDEFIVELSFDDYYLMLTKKITDDMIKKIIKSTGFSIEKITEIIHMAQHQQKVLLLTEDLVENIGCFSRIILSGNGIYMFKHITPQDESQQRVIVVKGSTKYIVDSIYNIGGKN